MKEGKASNRMVYLDVLRILAAFSVVMLHSAAQFWYALDVRSTEWLIANSYDAVFRFGVPVFVMISGALFLNPQYTVDIKHLYKHNILRLVIIYIVWSTIYGLFDCFWLEDIHTLGLKDILREIIEGRYHLWFLPMLVGIYILLPILKRWLECAPQKHVQYFLVLFLVLKVGAETLRAITVSDEIHSILDLAKVDLVCGYMGYFVWGYYLAHVEIGAKLRKWIYLSFVPALLCNVVLSCLLTRRIGRNVAPIYDSFGIFTFLISTALFLLCRNAKCSFSEKTGRIVAEIGAGTMGVYLLHIGIMEIMGSFGWNSMSLPNIIGIPVYAGASFVICLLLGIILRRIPVVGRYIC